MRAVLIDTNLLVLLLLGRLDAQNVGRHKLLAKYDIVHYQALAKYAASSLRHVSTPHVLAETSNLLAAGRGTDTTGSMSTFREYCMIVDEVFHEAHLAVQHPQFERLGLTDTVILERVVPDGVTVLTDDYELSQRVHFLGGKAINIWHTPLS